MRLFDTHAHLTRPEFDADRDAALDRARAQDVAMLTVGTCLATSQACVLLAEARDDVWAAVGIHPNDVDDAAPDDLDRLRELARHPKVRALGETGLDYYWQRTAPERQRAFLERHLEIARELDLAVVLHARQSEDDLLDAVEPFCRAGGRAVWHCFLSGKKTIRAHLERALDMGLWLGLGGMVTFTDQKPLREIVPLIPDRHLLLETDCPFLAPQPRPGGDKRNEPARLVRTAEEIANLRGVTETDIARITTRNALRLLKLNEAESPSHAPGALAYPIRDSLYVNLTNRCNNACSFCARNQEFVVKGHDLRLEREPTAEEMLDAIGDPAPWKEIVFCGFGEPTLRLEELKTISRSLKQRGARVRLNTNGLANLEHGRNVAPELAGLVDVISVSLNTADPEQYAELCRPRFGEQAYAGLEEFVRCCVAAGIETVCTVVAMPGIDVEAARAATARLGASFRARSFLDAG